VFSGPLQKQCKQLLSLQEFVLVMFKQQNILAKIHFSVNSVIQFSVECIMKSNTDDINLRVL
jgi:hypothetical protein